MDTSKLPPGVLAKDLVAPTGRAYRNHLYQLDFELWYGAPIH